jgi:hypothetical protein
MIGRGANATGNAGTRGAEPASALARKRRRDGMSGIDKGWVGDRCMTDRDIAKLDKKLGGGAPKKKKIDRPKPVKRNKKKTA